ncbi:MAG: biopolymer transporter ExbD [Cyanobacteria bacterium]|nr:biopolymer transporter ExbD [Cyanobacteriota bacterium]MDW8200357.1 biopolymer transporter ExbD [Cyanobacteriota bacterium SKYGB_h_bin112]
MKINLDGNADDVRIEILPLIDVIFCILTFFILAALQLTRQQGIAVDLPSATTGVPQIRQVFVVSVDALGQVYVDQQPVTIEQLKQQVVGYKQLNPEGMLVLYAPRNAIYDDVVTVLDLLRSIGGDRVALATVPTVNQPTISPAIPNVPGLSTTPQQPGAVPGVTPPGSPTMQPGDNLPLVPNRTVPANPQEAPPSPQVVPDGRPSGTIPGISPRTSPLSTPGAPSTPRTQLPLP